MNSENKHIAGTTVRLSRLKIQLQESRVILLFEGLSSRSNVIKKSFCGPTKVKFRTDVALFQDLNFSCEKVIYKYFCACMEALTCLAAYTFNKTRSKNVLRTKESKI